MYGHKYNQGEIQRNNVNKTKLKILKNLQRIFFMNLWMKIIKNLYFLIAEHLQKVMENNFYMFWAFCWEISINCSRNPISYENFYVFFRFDVRVTDRHRVIQNSLHSLWWSFNFWTFKEKIAVNTECNLKTNLSYKIFMK